MANRRSLQRPPPRRGAPGSHLTPPYLAPADLNYARAFRTLSSVQGEIMREGLTLELLLRRANVRMALGNYLAAAFDSERAVGIDPDNIEAQYLRGQSYLALAAVKHGVARPGVGADIPVRALPPRRHLLETARECFRRVLAARPDDQQATKAMVATERLMHDLARRTRKPVAEVQPELPEHMSAT